MTINKKALLALLAVSLLQANPSYAKSVPLTPVTTVYVDDRPLQLAAQPLLLEGTALVPMRQLFEAQGAELSRTHPAKTVTATKNEAVLTYRMGELAATLNGKTLSLNVPGQIVEGNTMIPLRFVSEALGSTVKWDALTRAIRIVSSNDFLQRFFRESTCAANRIRRELPLPCGLFQPTKRFMSSVRSMPSGWKCALKTT